MRMWRRGHTETKSNNKKKIRENQVQETIRVYGKAANKKEKTKKQKKKPSLEKFPRYSGVKVRLPRKEGTLPSKEKAKEESPPRQLYRRAAQLI